MKLLKNKIIILKTKKYSDNHLIVTGISPEGKKISLLAPAALKSRKRFGGGVLEPTHFVEIQFQDIGENIEKLPILKDAHLIEPFEGIRLDYDRLNTAFYFLNIIDSSHFDEAPDSDKIFSLVGHALKSLKTIKDIRSLRILFEIKYLYISGILEQTPSVEKYLKMRFQDDVSFPDDYENSPDYSRIKGTLQEYLRMKA